MGSCFNAVGAILVMLLACAAAFVMGYAGAMLWEQLKERKK